MNERAIQKQFAGRVDSFETAANWMLNPRLIAAHINAYPYSVKKNYHCLDLCCGTGILGRHFLERGWKVTGIDITKEMVEQANQYYPTVHGNVEKLPFENHQFEAAVLRQSYMLLHGPQALQEIKRVLKKNGLFILGQSVPFSDKDNDHYRRIQLSRHINIVKYHNSEELIKELESNGFTIKHTEYLKVRESIDYWLNGALALTDEHKRQIYNLIKEAPFGYKRERNVKMEDGELFEDWNWIVITAEST